MAEEKNKTLMTAAQLDDVLNRLAQEIAQAKTVDNSTVLIGIRTGGAFLAQRLKNKIESDAELKIPYGIVDINLYRDDWTRAATMPRVGKTEIPFSIDDKKVILVDDVLYTGRTIRAAMDALIDFGRPRSIELLVLVDRGHRELPICANYVGLVTPTGRNDLVNVLLEEKEGHDEVTLIKGN